MRATRKGVPHLQKVDTPFKVSNFKIFYASFPISRYKKNSFLEAN